MLNLFRLPLYDSPSYRPMTLFQHTLSAARQIAGLGGCSIPTPDSCTVVGWKHDMASYFIEDG
jgi:hypothetical protein